MSDRKTKILCTNIDAEENGEILKIEMFAGFIFFNRKDRSFLLSI